MFSMKNLLIIGARGWGREVFTLAQGCIGYQTEFVIKGFLDDKADALEGKPGYPPIIDSVEHYMPEPDDVFVCALGDVHWKKHYSEIIINKGGRFINLIHKTAAIGLNTHIGIGCLICQSVGISCDVTVGDFVTMQYDTVVGHDGIIGDFCHFGNRTFVGGRARLGESCVVNTGGIILPNVQLGNNCVVGAGSVVTKKVADGNTVYGNPAKVLKF